MKSILISIKPKWVAKILNGEKTIEIRKRFPKDYRGWVYIYCTKADDLCKICKISRDRYICGKDYDNREFPHLHSGYNGKGKVVARFWCDKVETLGGGSIYQTVRAYYLLQSMFLTANGLFDYLNGQEGYALKISDLVIFDKPKELSEFKSIKDCHKCWHSVNKQNCLNCGRLTKAPQSWCYVEEI